jgi:hypothetical protein
VIVDPSKPLFDGGLGPSGSSSYMIGLVGELARRRIMAREKATQYDIKAEDIAEVTLSLPARAMKLYYAQPFSIRSFPTGDALFSFAYTTACALLRRQVTPADMTDHGHSQLDQPFRDTPLVHDIGGEDEEGDPEFLNQWCKCEINTMANTNAEPLDTI